MASNLSPGRILAIGDIHGCASSLETMLELIQPTSEDTIVVLGDVVDRGPNSRDAVQLLIELQRRLTVVFILGNHEETMLDAVADPAAYLDIWMTWGGRSTLDSYGGLDAIPEEHVRWLKAGLPYWETETHAFIHANLEPGVALANQKTSMLRWRRLKDDPLPHCSGKHVVCGHTAQESGLPLVFPQWTCIDTHAYGGGYLTCFDIAGTFYQANESGATRSFPSDPLSFPPS